MLFRSDDSGVAAIAVGTLLWALALGAMLIAGTSISSALGGIDTGQWTLVCGIGFALGIPGLAIVLARRSRLRRRAQF